MAGTIVVCGYGTGISEAVARRFGREGYAVALVARSAEKVEAGAAALREAGVKARGFACDLGDPEAVRRLIRDAGAALGPVAVIHWNAYSSRAGDLLSASAADLRSAFDVGVVGLVAALQEALPAMKGQPDAAVLITGGGFSAYDPRVDAMTVQYRAMGLGLAKAAQHKLSGLLHERLKGEGVYVGEVVVMGSVKGTAFDGGQATLAPDTVAERFWTLHRERREVSVAIA